MFCISSSPVRLVARGISKSVVIKIVVSRRRNFFNGRADSGQCSFFLRSPVSSAITVGQHGVSPLEMSPGVDQGTEDRSRCSSGVWGEPQATRNESRCLCKSVRSLEEGSDFR